MLTIRLVFQIVEAYIIKNNNVLKNVVNNML